MWKRVVTDAIPDLIPGLMASMKGDSQTFMISYRDKDESSNIVYLMPSKPTLPDLPKNVCNLDIYEKSSE